VSDRITLAITGSSDTDVASLVSHADMIAGETLAVETSFVVSADPETAAALAAPAGTQRATLSIGQYANAGVLVVDVAKVGAVNV
jgi:hypothetical protein